MAHLRKRYLKNLRKANLAFERGNDPSKFLLRKYKYWHRLYQIESLWK